MLQAHYLAQEEFFLFEFTWEIMAHNACLRLSMGISSEIKVMAIVLKKQQSLRLKQPLHCHSDHV